VPNAIDQRGRQPPKRGAFPNLRPTSANDRRCSSHHRVEPAVRLVCGVAEGHGFSRGLVGATGRNQVSLRAELASRIINELNKG